MSRHTYHSRLPSSGHRARPGASSSQRRRYTVIRFEGLRVVSRLLREAVWDMSSSEDYAPVLSTLTEGFRTLRIPHDGCGIYVVDADMNPAVVVSQYILRDGKWHQALPARDRDAAINVWRGAATTYVMDVRQDEPQLDSAVYQRFGCQMGSVVDVPFANGVLTVTSRQVRGFSWRDIEMLRDLAEGLPPLFYRTACLQKLELRDRQMVRSQKLEMVGQLAVETAHEVNNLLTVMRGQCDLLLMDELDPAVRESLEIVLKVGESTQALLARLLDLARKDEPQRSTCNLNRLVRESLQLVRRQLAYHHVELVEEFGVDLPLVHVQPGQIQQVLLNLLNNSRDAVTASGRRGRIAVRTWHADGVVRLAVEDDGPGVPEAVREKIFEPFFTTKETGKGTGLGLSVCRTIAASHDGNLYAEEAAHGRGTCFVLELPAADAADLTSP